MPVTHVRTGLACLACLAGWAVFGPVADARAIAGIAIFTGCGAASVGLHRREAAAAVAAHDRVQAIAG